MKYLRLTVVSVAEFILIQNFIPSRGKTFQAILGLSLISKTIKCPSKFPYQNLLIICLFEMLNLLGVYNTSGSDA